MGAQLSSLLSSGEAENCRECRDGMDEHASPLQGCFNSCGCGSGLGEAKREQRQDHSQHQRRGLNAVEKNEKIGGYEISKLRHELDSGAIQGTVHIKAFGVEHFDKPARSFYRCFYVYLVTDHWQVTPSAARQLQVCAGTKFEAGAFKRGHAARRGLCADATGGW